MEYVDCIMCPNWTLEFRHREFCKICNNTGKMQDPATILCNNCGDCMCSLNNIDQPCNYLMPNGLLDIKVSGSYDSDHLTDTIEYTFNLCEKCIRGMFKAFKIKPILNNWADKLSCYSYEEDEINYEYRLWKNDGGHHKAYLDRLCNQVKDCKNEAKYSIYNYDNSLTEDCCCEEHKDSLFVFMVIGPFIPNNLKVFI